MIDMKLGLCNVPFKYNFLYYSMFVMHFGKLKWLWMPMGLTQAPEHFWYITEDILRGQIEVGTFLVVVVYFNDIAVSVCFARICAE